MMLTPLLYSNCERQKKEPEKTHESPGADDGGGGDWADYVQPEAQRDDRESGDHLRRDMENSVEEYW